VYRPRLDGREPQREAVRAEGSLDVAAVGVRLAGVPQVDDCVFGAEGRFLAAVAGDDRPTRITWQKPCSLARSKAWYGPGA
jgi:hypothetical protein